MCLTQPLAPVLIRPITDTPPSGCTYMYIHKYTLSPSLQESRRNFLHSVEMGSHKKKLEGFMSFCEDTIFEMDYADKISGTEQQTRETRAFQHRLEHTKSLQTPPQSVPDDLLHNYNNTCISIVYTYSNCGHILCLMCSTW